MTALFMFMQIFLLKTAIYYNSMTGLCSQFNIKKSAFLKNKRSFLCESRLWTGSVQDSRRIQDHTANHISVWLAVGVIYPMSILRSFLRHLIAHPGSLISNQ